MLHAPHLWAQDESVGQEEMKRSARNHLAEELLRVAGTAIQTYPLDVQAIEAGLALVKTAAQVAPDNPSVWRAWVELAVLSDNPEMRQRGTKELLRLDPNETPLQLARLRDAVDTLNTVAERTNLYEKLLSPEGQSLLHPNVASRLAFDAAMLQRQLGNTQQFARWLAESVALDPYFTDAMAVSVGFFGDESADSYRRVELLSSLMLANMREVTTQVTLAELLMSYGAYNAASRIYGIALSGDADKPKVVGGDLLSDIVMAKWASREVDEALDLLSARQRVVDERFRQNIKAQETRATPLELARIHAPLAPKLATVKAAIFADVMKGESEWAVRSALDSFAALLLNAETYQQTGDQINETELCLQAAWIAVWLDDLVEDANSFLKKAATYTELTSNDTAIVDGWIAFRLGELQKAEELFTDTDADASTAGLAMVRLRQDRQQEAARLFLQLAQESAGTLLGVWSRNQLEQLLGQDIRAREDTLALESLIQEIPNAVDQYATDPRTTFTIRTKPVKENVGPYEPILVEIELSNNSLMPMQIAPEGPITNLVLLQVEAQIVNAKVTTKVPIILPIDRKLTLPSRERFTVTVDLRKHWVGAVLNEWPTNGGILQLQGMTNFSIRLTENLKGETEMVYEPSMLGTRSKTQQLRVDGVRLTDVWLENTIANIEEMNSGADLMSFVLLTWAVGDDVQIQVVEPLIPPPPGEEKPTLLEGERHPLQDQAITKLLLAFPSLDAFSKAWILSTMSKDPAFESLIMMTDEDEHSLTTISWLLRFISPTVQDITLDNERLLSARDDKDQNVRAVANWVYRWVEAKVAQRRDRALGTFEEE
jgi:hypothetical protein